ncbi:MAG: cobalt transport protein [Oscillospiraceae bacterium]|nr:cobalt transport protein [Oscillospiraceae bacterium]
MRSFDAMNPAAAAVHLLMTVCITIFCTEPILLTVSFIGALVFYLALNGSRNRAFHIGAIGMPTLFALLNPLWNQHGTTVLFLINDRAITAEALFFGAMTGVRLAAVLYWFRIFSDLMTSEKLFYLFRFLSPKLALVFTMAVRNLTLFRQQAQRIQTAQKGLGLYREDHLIDDIRGRLRVFSILLTWALENGIVTANSMAARGYGIGKRTSCTYFRWHTADLLFLAAVTGLGAAVIAGMVSGAGEWQFYPVCEPPAMDLRYFALLIPFAVIAVLPLIHECREKYRSRVVM